MLGIYPRLNLREQVLRQLKAGEIGEGFNGRGQASPLARALGQIRETYYNAYLAQHPYTNKNAPKAQ